MDWFLNWLKKEVKGFKIIGFVLLIIIIDGLYNLAVFGIVWFFGFADPPSLGFETSDLVWYFPIKLFIFALFEEMIFRIAPLVVVVDIFKKQPKKWLFVALISSMLFGVMHGGPINIFIQGVGGFLYCIIFLKCGGASISRLEPYPDDLILSVASPEEINEASKRYEWKLGKKLIKPTLCCTTAHFIFNSSIALLVLLMGGRTL